MTPLVLFATALLVRAIVGAASGGPAYPDSYYYVSVARELAAGNGLTIDYIWNFVDVGGRLPADGALPIPSNGHWMPLAALVQVPAIWLLGPTSLAAGLPLWIAGAFAAPLTYWIARDAGLTSHQAVAAGFLAAVPAGLTPFFGQPDNFGLFMTLGALALWLCARGAAGDRRAFLLGGMVVGLATLARSDGVLLGLPFALVALRHVGRSLRASATRSARIDLATAIGCAALFALVVAPWLVRQLEVFGSIAPSASNGRILWIREYSELYSVATPATLQTLLADGPAAFIASRVGGLLSALGLFALLPLAVVLVPFALLGVWLRRRDPSFQPFLIYALVLFAASGLLFAVHVPHGTFIHSAVALLPHTFTLVIAGIGAAAGWLAARRPAWDAARSASMFGYGAVIVAVGGAAVQSVATIADWNEVRAVQARLARPLNEAGERDHVMSADAGAYHYLTGRPGIVTPTDDLATIETALRRYNVRWLALEQAAISPALAPVLRGDVRPAWLSRPVAVVRDGGVMTASTGVVADRPPAGALYAVCLDEGDDRCAP